ncbi:MAG: hypothetical protein WCQ99_02755 [Pseudomonadota bacterium]
MNEKLRLIDVALENEIHEWHFYQQHSCKMHNPAGKQMFARIAEDEREHLLQLHLIHEEVSARGRWAEYSAPFVHGTDIRQFYIDIAKTSADIVPATAEDREAISAAIDFELRGYTFYHNLSRSAETHAEHVFFVRLAEMEREHFLSLKESQLYFEDPGQWVAQHEKQSLEGYGATH